MFTQRADTCMQSIRTWTETVCSTLRSALGQWRAVRWLPAWKRAALRMSRNRSSVRFSACEASGTLVVHVDHRTRRATHDIRSPQEEAVPKLSIWNTVTRRAPHVLFELITDLQTSGLRIPDAADAGVQCDVGADPSGYKAVRLAEQTIMVRVHAADGADSPFEVRELDPDGGILYRDGHAIIAIEFARTPRFYKHSTRDGIPYWKIASLHGLDVLASTVSQHCVRYADNDKTCSFCAIGQALAADSTLPQKTPAQLAEVAQVAVKLDDVKHMLLTTGTPGSQDRGAAALTRASAAVRRAVPGLPIHAQCEPPHDFGWFRRMAEAGVNTLGMHIDAVSEPVRARMTPGKAELPVSFYFDAFQAAGDVFGFGQVTTCIVAGLGDSAEDIVNFCRRAARLGVYSLVVPFTPIAGTPLAAHPPPSAAWMRQLLYDVAEVHAWHGLNSQKVHAGCARCGACSTLRAAEGYGSL